MNHKEFFEKNGGTKLLTLFNDDVEIENLYQAFKARMQAEALASSQAKFTGITFEAADGGGLGFVDPKSYGAVPDEANDNVVKFCTGIVIPADAMIEIPNAVTGWLWLEKIPRGGHLVSVTLEFAEY